MTVFSVINKVDQDSGVFMVSTQARDIVDAAGKAAKQTAKAQHCPPGLVVTLAVFAGVPVATNVPTSAVA